MAMTPPTGKFRIRRRGALLLIIASIAMAAPITGRHAMEAYAKDDGSDGGSDGGGGGGGGSGGGGSDDGGSDDGGSDDGGSDDGGSDDSGSDDGGSDDNGSDDGGGSGSGSSGKSGSGSSGSSGKSSKSSSAAKDSALATRLKGRIAPIREIERLAGKVVPGEIIDVKLYRNKDRYIYKVKIIQRNGSIYDVRIDAVSRKLLSARER
jgi:uncharacterized membrane protein YkoI